MYYVMLGETTRRKLSLGEITTVNNLENAKKTISKYKIKVEMGINPATPEDSSKTDPTLEDVFNIFIKKSRWVIIFKHNLNKNNKWIYMSELQKIIRTLTINYSAYKRIEKDIFYDLLEMQKSFNTTVGKIIKPS